MGNGEKISVLSSGVNSGGRAKQLRQTNGDTELTTPVDAQMGEVEVTIPKPPSVKDKGVATVVLKTPRYSTSGGDESVPVGPTVRESSTKVDLDESDEEGEENEP